MPVIGIRFNNRFCTFIIIGAFLLFLSFHVSEDVNLYVNSSRVYFGLIFGFLEKKFAFSTLLFNAATVGSLSIKVEECVASSVSLVVGAGYFLA